MKVGDIVRQVGNDVPMTVSSTVTTKQRVYCMWFIGEELYKDWFPVSELEIIT